MDLYPFGKAQYPTVWAEQAQGEIHSAAAYRRIASCAQCMVGRLVPACIQGLWIQGKDLLLCIAAVLHEYSSATGG